MSIAYRIALAVLLAMCAGCDKPSAKHDNPVKDELRCIGIPRQGLSAANKIRACTTLIQSKTADKQDLASHRYWRGIWYSDLGQCKQAIKDFDEALSLKPGYILPGIYLERGRAFACQDQYPKAIENFDQAISHDPKLTRAFVERAFAHLMLYQLDEAIDDCTRAVTSEHNNARAYAMRGFAFFSKGDYARAIQDFDTSIRLDDTDADIFLQRGSAHGRLQHYSLALADFDKAISLRHDFADAFSRRGLLERKMGQQISADRDYDRAITVGSDDARSLDTRCGIRADWKRDLALGLAECNRALQSDRDRSYYLATRALIHFRMGNYGETIEDCDASLAIAKSALTLYLRGLAKARAGLKGADSDIAAAKTLHPSVAENFSDFDRKP